MIMLNKYIKNGTVDRAAIAMDVKTLKLKRDDIITLCKVKEVQDSFIGQTHENKKPKKYWNKEYLDLLYWSVVAESFNLDYLLHLNEVAEFVSKAKFKKVIIAGVIIVLVIIAGVIAFSYILAQEVL